VATGPFFFLSLFALLTCAPPPPPPPFIAVVNLTLTPAQVALIPVFVNFGGSIVLLFNSDATTEDVSVSAMIDALKSNFLEAMGVFKDILLYAFLGWVVFSIVAIPVIYFAATPLLAYGLKRWRKRKAAMSPSESQIFSNGEDDVDDMDGLEESEEIDIKGIETGAGVAMKPLRQPSMSASSDRRGSFLGGATSAAVTPRVDDGAINARNGGGDGSLLHDNNNEIDTLVDDNADQQPLLAGDGHSN